MSSPKDHFLLSIGSEVYKVFPDRDGLLPLLIKDIPSLPVISNQRIKIDVDTASEWSCYSSVLETIVNAQPSLVRTDCESSTFVSGGVEWISTGLYLSPGMKTTLTLPAAIINNGWKVLCCSELPGE